MSFIGKLLRKTEPLTPPIGATAPLDERVLAEAPDVGQEIADGVPAADSADETRADDPESAPDDQAQSLPAAEQANDTAWWEEPPPTTPMVSSSPAIHSNQTELAESGNVAERYAEAAVEPAPQTAELGNLDDGTRPLTAADIPTLAALRSHRGLAAGALRDVGRVRSINQDSL
ncbi:MAG: hypothetical protein ABI901_02535, partial [Roseiflexaceae bacterium]